MSARISMNLTLDNFTYLDDTAALSLLDTLIYVELSKLNLRKDTITSRYTIHAADMAIDGMLEHVTSDPPSAIIFRGSTYYKVKSGTVSLDESTLRSLLQGRHTALHTAIKAVAEADGHLVMCFPGIHAQPVSKAEMLLLEIIKESVPQTKVRVTILQAEDLAEIAQRHVTLDFED